ncbi:FAD-dependent monooxygenase fsr3 [Fusarium oxysporum f. sp. albedinis]|nr:FAD-dependent monooxygenase fsr3 [Fusarium oxysporum f. sp. albedinis]
MLFMPSYAAAELEELIICHQEAFENIALVRITLSDDADWRICSQKIIKGQKLTRILHVVYQRLKQIRTAR